jgi:hypothetical protein
MIYEAIIKTAQHIEDSPQSYDFTSCIIPRQDDCRSPGCAVGWICYFAGEIECGEIMDQMCRRVLGVNFWSTFRKRMDELANGWPISSTACAKGLRLYAAKYHKPVSREIPGAILNLFNEVIPQPITVKPVDVPQL